jgi:acetylornithine deacetylase/succinyl-diaminopimelate desuccinylase family protein
MADSIRRAVGILNDLIRIRSCDSDETAIVEYLEKRLAGQGVSCTVLEKDGKPLTLVAEVGSGERSLMFNAHTDTVALGDLSNWDTDPLDPVERDGRIYGRGACDDKGSLAAMLVAFESLLRDGSWQNQGRLILAAVGGEERGGTGTQLLVEKGFTADAAVIGECTDLQPVIAHKGALRLEVITQGVLAHASEPEQGVNAIDAMAPLIMRLKELSRQIEKRVDPLCSHATLSVTTIRGGVALNVIPDECVISIDRRLIPCETEQAAWHEIEEALTDEAARHGIKFRLRRVRCLPPAKVEADEEIVRVCTAALGDQVDSRACPTGFKASCDMTFLVNGAHIPTVVIGPGPLDMAHKANEWVDVNQLEAAACLYEDIARRWFRA